MNSKFKSHVLYRHNATWMLNKPDESPCLEEAYILLRGTDEGVTLCEMGPSSVGKPRAEKGMMTNVGKGATCFCGMVGRDISVQGRQLRDRLFQTKGKARKNPEVKMFLCLRNNEAIMAGAKGVQMTMVEDRGRQTNNGQITNGLMGD